LFLGTPEPEPNASSLLHSLPPRIIRSPAPAPGSVLEKKIPATEDPGPLVPFEGLYSKTPYEVIINQESSNTFLLNFLHPPLTPSSLPLHLFFLLVAFRTAHQVLTPRERNGPSLFLFMISHSVASLSLLLLLQSSFDGRARKSSGMETSALTEKKRNNSPWVQWQP
jgi:hypothetical protein